MKLSKVLVAAALALPLTLGTFSAEAGHKGHKGHRGECEQFNYGMLRQLDLSEEQKAQIKSLKKDAKAAMKAKYAENKDEIRANVSAHREQVQSLMLADSFDEQAARELATAKAEKQIEMGVKKMAMHHKMIQVLTEEQKAKLATLQQERTQHCQNKMNKRFEKES